VAVSERTEMHRLIITRETNNCKSIHQSITVKSTSAILKQSTSNLTAVNLD
jgi:hypothetical protein